MVNRHNSCSLENMTHYDKTDRSENSKELYAYISRAIHIYQGFIEGGGGKPPGIPPTTTGGHYISIILAQEESYVLLDNSYNYMILFH